MPDERTYGLNIDDANAVIQSIDTREIVFPEIWPRGGRGGSGRVTSVRFKIVSSDPTTLSGLANIIAWDYGFSKTQIPATIAGNTVIEICDPMGCFLNEPNVDLTDRAGVAVYRDADAIDNCRTGYAPFDGVWEVTSLCCKLLSCDVVI